MSILNKCDGTLRREKTGCLSGARVWLVQVEPAGRLEDQFFQYCVSYIREERLARLYNRISWWLISSQLPRQMSQRTMSYIGTYYIGTSMGSANCVTWRWTQAALRRRPISAWTQFKPSSTFLYANRKKGPTTFWFLYSVDSWSYRTHYGGRSA